MRRRDNGQPLRTAMTDAGLDIPTLSVRTREVDPDGRGLSVALVGFAVGAGKSARENQSERAATLLAAALGKPVEHLFHEDVLSQAEQFTSTSRLQSEMTTLPAPLGPQVLEPMVDLKGLCAAIGRGRTWVYEQRRAHPRGSATPFPYHQVGHEPRYRVSEVLAWCEAVFAPVAA